MKGKREGLVKKIVISTLVGMSCLGIVPTYAETNLLINKFELSEDSIKYKNKETIGKILLDLPHHDTALDNGATYGKYNEREIAESISLKVKDILEKNGVQVELMREKDEVISINDRVKRANSLGEYDYYISLHINSCKYDNTGTGVEGWSNMGWSLTNRILKGLSKEFNYTNRGIFPTEFYNLLIHNKSTLIEMGFINNDTDRYNLINKQDEYADIIAHSIIEQLKADNLSE